MIKIACICDSNMIEVYYHSPKNHNYASVPKEPVFCSQSFLCLEGLEPSASAFEGRTPGTWH